VVQRWGCGHAIKRSQVRSPAGHCCGQVVHTHVPLSPSSIVWYRCKSWGGRLWKRCGLPSLTLGVSPLPAKDQQDGDYEHCTLASHGLCLQLCCPLGGTFCFVLYSFAKFFTNWRIPVIWFCHCRLRRCRNRCKAVASWCQWSIFGVWSYSEHLRHCRVAIGDCFTNSVLIIF